MINLYDEIKSHVTEDQFESAEIDTYGMEKTIHHHLREMITFSSNYRQTSKGYQGPDGKYYGRQDIVDKYLKEKS